MSFISSSSGSESTATTSHTITAPDGGIADGSLLLLEINVPDVTAPDETWEEMDWSPLAIGSKSMTVYGKLASSEPASWDFTSALSATASWALGVYETSATSVSSAINVVAHSTTSPTGSSCSTDSITPTIDGCTIVVLAAGTAASAITNDPQTTEREDAFTESLTAVVEFADTTAGAAATYGGYNLSCAFAQFWAWAVIAIAPPVAEADLTVASAGTASLSMALSAPVILAAGADGSSNADVNVEGAPQIPIESAGQATVVVPVGSPLLITAAADGAAMATAVVTNPVPMAMAAAGSSTTAGQVAVVRHDVGSRTPPAGFSSGLQRPPRGTSFRSSGPR